MVNRRKQSFRELAAVALLVFLGLIANGRPIVAGDTRVMERVAASLVTAGDFDLDEFPEVSAPFSMKIGEHRVSIYPVLPAVLAYPVFYVANTLFVFNETGCALAGKFAASLFSSAAAAVFFMIVLRLHGRRSAWIATLIFAWGTSIHSTSQALWQHPAAALFLSVTLLFIVMAENDDAWAGRAGLPLALTFAARHADIAIVSSLALVIAWRWRRRIASLVAWGAPVLVLLSFYQAAHFGCPLRHGFSDKAGWFDAPWGVGHFGLLLSPARGLLVFTPVVIVSLVGIARSWHGAHRRLAVAATLAASAHWIFMGRWGAWHGGVCWGPRMMTGVLPLLFLFLPAGLARLPMLGALLALFSIGAQQLGAFAYDDYRWERLYQWKGMSFHAALWSWRDSPLLFHARERVLVLALPAIRDRRAEIHRYPMVLAGPSGSQIAFANGRVVVSGDVARFSDVHLVRRAKAHDDRLSLQGRWSGLFLRVKGEGRRRPLELRIAGKGEGRLYVGIRRFLGRTTYSTFEMSGDFEWRSPYEYAAAPGPDIFITTGRTRDPAVITNVSLE
ncbi:MAG: hypothetical protein JXO72_12530 [Vicinamibacteria bacterium]|nr:hypothetical protein [Vicinamibacteria bacterium]